MRVWILLIAILFSQSLFAHAGTTALGDRIDLLSKQYLGLPYLVDPLGEAQGYDQDPLYRFDGFDCLTYVETVLALAMASSEQEFQSLINKIRYKNAQVDFITRNHFTSVDWIKYNRQKGLISDETRRLFPYQFKVSKTRIERAAWFKKVHNMDVDTRTSLSLLAYLPLDTAIQNPEMLSNIPTGSIITIVRPNWNVKESLGTNLDISHLGFAIWKNEILYFRHASSSAKVVTEEPLLDYLRKMNSIPSIGGINVLEAH